VERLAQQSQIDFDIEFFERILSRSPDYVDVLRCQGELLTRKGLHERALQVDQRLVRLRPTDEVVQYNLACSLAQLGSGAAALGARRRAFELGYRDFEHLTADTDLAGLHDDPAFQALVREFQPRKRAKSVSPFGLT
jgi:tetratricopeptide (TPR) repeat protein